MTHLDLCIKLWSVKCLCTSPIKVEVNTAGIISGLDWPDHFMKHLPPASSRSPEPQDWSGSGAVNMYMILY